MEENKITITAWRYAELIRTEERVRCLRRMMASNEYVSTGDVKAVLDIKDKEEVQGENEAV